MNTCSMPRKTAQGVPDCAIVIRAPSPPTIHLTTPATLRRVWLPGIVMLVTCGSPQLLASPHPSVQPATNTTTATSVRFADFGVDKPSADARYLANWVADSRDNGATEFFIVDKKDARVYAFNAAAHLTGSSAVLLGSAKGDDSVPGIGLKPIAAVKPSERTTPAGRFLAERGRNTSGEDVVWVDYDAAVSMHRVRTTNAKERRLERLATPTAEDNRISYGCINVPVAFYNAHIKPAFAKHRAVVYVLPEVKPVQQVFGSYDVAARHALVPR